MDKIILLFEWDIDYKELNNWMMLNMSISAKHDTEYLILDQNQYTAFCLRFQKYNYDF